MLRIEGADVEAGEGVGLKRIQKSSLFEIEPRNLRAVADEVDVAVGWVVDKVAAELWDSEPVVTTVLRVNLIIEFN